LSIFTNNLLFCCKILSSYPSISIKPVDTACASSVKVFACFACALVIVAISSSNVNAFATSEAKLNILLVAASSIPRKLTCERL